MKERWRRVRTYCGLQGKVTTFEWLPQTPEKVIDQARCDGALGRIRTCDARFRKPTLYPLSYEGGKFHHRRSEPLRLVWGSRR